MSVNVPVFFTKPSGRTKVSLRRYASKTIKVGESWVTAPEYRCPSSAAKQGWDNPMSENTYHNEEVLLGTLPEKLGEPYANGRGFHREIIVHEAEIPRTDPRWPTRCSCGYEFKPEDDYQINQETIYVRADGLGGEYTIRNPEIGQMWDLFWMPDRYKSVDGGPGWINIGPDGLALCIIVPGGGFEPEGRCSNCTLPHDGEHKCWVRHGDARKNECHIDKNGVTCSAGAGSIVTSTWHGFIHHGFITDVPEHLVR